MRYFTISTTAEAICFLIALGCLAKDSSRIWRCMVVFLFVTCATEMTGIYVKRLYLADKLHVHPNVWLYNILLLFQASFISLMFHHLLGKYSNRRHLILSGLVLLGALYVFETLAHGIFIYNNITNTVMSVLFVVYSYYYYYCLLKADEHLTLTFSPEFWWVAGALFYFFGRTASNVLFNIISLLNPEIVTTYPIYKVLNVILYTYWSYSFICRKWLTSASKVQFQ